ncbi:MAG: tandem-95 repeat protein [Bacteroidetes bacterium]|nr:tandem-95 repeat protein [Bacteroidota bacterium]
MPESEPGNHPMLPNCFFAELPGYHEFRCAIAAISGKLAEHGRAKGLIALVSLLIIAQLQQAGAQNQPLAANDIDWTSEDFTKPIAVMANDVDVDGDLDSNSLVIINPPMNGTAVVNPVTHVVQYTPNPNYHGFDQFRYQVADFTGLTNSAQVTITIYPINDPPVVNDDFDSLLEGSSAFIRVALNDDDPVDPLGNINPNSISILTPPSHGSATPLTGPLGRVLYVPTSGYTGLDSFQYQICDDGHPWPAQCEAAWVYLNVRGRVVAGPDRTICPGDSVRLTATGPGPYTWSPAAGLSCTNCNSPWADPVTSTVYTVSSTAGGCCPNSDNITVTVYTPGILSANADAATLNEDASTSLNVVVNDVVVDSLEFYPHTPPLHGAISFDAGGNATYTPQPNYYGLDSAAYIICPPACPASCDTGWVVFSITPLNDAPLAVTDSATTLEDTPVGIVVLGNDSDPDGGLNPASVNIALSPANGSASVDLLSGTITYTPNPDFNGIDSFRYQVCDTGFPLPQACSEAWVIVTVVEVNDPVQAFDDAETTFEDNAFVTFPLNNDFDPENRLDTASLTLVSGPLHGVVVIFPATGGLQYTPNPNYNGPDSLQYRVCDDQVPGTCDEARLAIIVLPLNDAPTLTDDINVTDEDLPVSTDVLANDSDIDGSLDPATVAIVSGPYHGTASVDTATGQVLYTPSPDFFGTDSLRYSACDDGTPLPAACGEALLVILVIPVNDPVSAADDVFAVLEDTPTWLDLLANDTDPDGSADPASVTVIAGPAHGSTLLNPATGEVRYAPDANYAGPDTFRYRVCDDGIPAGCSEATVYLDVLPVNDPPVALDDTASGLQDSPMALDPLANDSDLDGNIDVTSFSLIVSALNGSISFDAGSGTATYTPAPGFFGSDSAQYQICDDGTPLPAACDSAWMVFTVLEVPPLPNVKPIALRDTASVFEDNAVVLAVLANDGDPDGALVPATLSIWSGPLQASATVDLLTGTVLFTPNPDVYGPDSFAYRICDNGLTTKCDSAWVRVQVLPVNDAPLAVNDTAFTGMDTAVTVFILLNDSDIDGAIDAFTASMVSPPLNGIATYDPATGALLYTPNAGFIGTDTLAYAVCDDGFPLPALCDTALVFIHVGWVPPVNAAPTANDDFFTLLEDSLLDFTVWTNDSDPEGLLDLSTLVSVEGPWRGTLLSGSGAAPWRYTPSPDFNGLDSLRYRVCDAASPALCDTATVYLQVLPVADAPVALPDSAGGIQDSDLILDLLLNLLVNDYDVDGDLDPSSVTLQSLPVRGTLTELGGTYTYRPENGWCGTDSFRYQVCDLTGLCADARVTLRVDCVAAPFYAIDDAYTLAVSAEALLPVLDNDAPEAEAACLQVLVPPSFGAVSIESNGQLRYSPSPYFAGLDSLRYSVCNADGTESAEATVKLTLYHDQLLVAGGLSPNGDGKNDVFRILGLDLYPNHTLSIVNRWGDVVFQAAPYNNDWDGLAGAQVLPEGTYFYLLNLDPQQPKALLTGSITLRR